MKRLLSLFFLVLFTSVAAAQVSKTIIVTMAGTLSTLFTATEKTTVTNLTITGNIDARDFVTLRDSMPVLAVLNISGVSIMAYNGSGTYPNTSSYPANEIPQYSFYNPNTYISKTVLKTITLPTTITSIGDAAFLSCTGLTPGLTITNSVISIGSSAFYNCIGLLGSLTIPNSVTSIGDNAFNNCTGLTIVTIGSGVTSIGEYAFTNNNNLKIINCLNSIPPTLGSYTFRYLTPSIVYVPSTSVSAYKAADGWSAFTIATEKHVNINNPIAGSLANELIAAGYGPLSSITHLTVTGNLSNVDISQMNAIMTALTLVDISGASLTGNTLPANAFQNKTTLTSISLPATTISIGNYAFSGCMVLSGVIPIPPAITSIGSDAFQNCASLIGFLTLPTGLNAINSYAFAGCTGLNGNLTIPGTVTSLGDGVFFRCNGLTGSLSIPNSVATIGNHAFQGCTGFTGTLTLPNAISTISDNAFNGCNGFSGTLIIPVSVSSIGSFSFSGCTGLTQLFISKNVSTINDYAFNNCSGLQKISVDHSIPPTIYANTFTGVSRGSTTLEVPTGSGGSYKTANYWSSFFTLSEAIMTNNYCQLEKLVRVYVLHSEIVVEGIPEGETVTLYSLNGVQLQSAKSHGERMILQTKPNAIYLVRTASKTYKVIL